MFTIDPPPASAIAVRTARIPSITPSRFTARIRRWSSRDTSSSSVGGTAMPALFTRTSSFPNAATVARTARSHCSGSVTSSGATMAAVTPISPTTVRALSYCTSATTTLAPSAANRRASAAPWPCAAPVISATLPARRPVTSPARDARSFRLATVDEVESLGDDRGVGLVAPFGLHDEERHDRALRLLLVRVDDAAFAVEHVALDDRPVVHELLLAVQHEAALLHELAHGLEHRVLTTGRIGRLLLSERAHVAHDERIRRRHRDAVEAGRRSRVGVVVHGVVVLQRRGEELHRTALDAHLARARGLPDDARVDGHVLVVLSSRYGDAPVRPDRSADRSRREVFVAGGCTRKWACSTARSPSS